MYKRIMILLDDRPVTQYALREGTALAAAHGAEAVYLGLTAGYAASAADFATFGAVAPEDFHQAAVARTDELLDEAMVYAESAGVLAKRISSQPNADALSVVESARRRRCDLIVVAADNHNAVVRLFNGSLLPGLITASTVPVLICKHLETAQEAAT